MTTGPTGGGKLPGKTLYAGRRRAMTRSSGFTVHDETSGGEFRRENASIITLQPGNTVTVSFLISDHSCGSLIGYGAWFWHSEHITYSLIGGPKKRTLTEYGSTSWNKAGSMWSAQDASPVDIKLIFSANSNATIALYLPQCGVIKHKHLDSARPELMRNMYQFSPEALFISDKGIVRISLDRHQDDSGQFKDLILKSCNRCGRYLPVNIPLERDQLSFSNHCVAEHRRPCKHATFGRLRNIHDDTEILKLEYGFQLECRYCKKFEVNAAHNPQRTSAQMKEDGARRRAFELLLAELYNGTPQLRYRHEKGSELANDVWHKFNCACFKCGTKLPRPRDMHLDHTRPLALLWPLDGTATALCGSCNSEKRDRAPSEFYTPAKLEELSTITGIPLADLNNTYPNEEAIELLMENLDWFFEYFLQRPEMTKERDGKIAGELVLKALDKVLARSSVRRAISLQALYDLHQRRGS